MAKHRRERCVREIHTGLYGEYAEAILNDVMRYCRTYALKLDLLSFKLVEFERGVDNEIMLAVFDDLYNVSRFKTVFRDRFKTDEQVRAWLAGCVKGVAKKCLEPGKYTDIHKAEIAKSDGWSRANDKIIHPPEGQGGVPAAAYYAVYEVLKGRKVAKAKFPGDVFDKTVGQPFDPVRVELETYRREAANKIKADLTAEVRRLEKEFQSEYEKLKSRFDSLKQEARAKADKAEHALNNEIFAALNMAA